MPIKTPFIYRSRVVFSSCTCSQNRYAQNFLIKFLHTNKETKKFLIKFLVCLVRAVALEVRMQIGVIVETLTDLSAIVACEQNLCVYA